MESNITNHLKVEIEDVEKDVFCRKQPPANTVEQRKGENEQEQVTDNQQMLVTCCRIAE